MFQKDNFTQNKQKLAIIKVISPILNKYESQRKKVAFWSLISVSFITLILFFLTIWIIGAFLSVIFDINSFIKEDYFIRITNSNFQLILLIFIIVGLYCLFYFIQTFKQILVIFNLIQEAPNLVTKKNLGKKFRQKFKDEVIPKVLTIANSNLIYEPNKKINAAILVESCLFFNPLSFEFYENSVYENGIVDYNEIPKISPRKCEKFFETEDFMTEIVPKFGLEICEINIKNPDFHARSLISKKLISNGFQGLFITANFVNQFANEAILTTPLFLFPPEFATNSSTLNGESLEKVVFESPLFGRNFEVFGDQLEARLVLQTDIMDRLNFLKAKYQRPILASFLGDRLSIAVEFGTDLFEPTIFVPARTELIQEFIETVEIIQDLVVSLKLRKN